MAESVKSSVKCTAKKNKTEKVASASFLQVSSSSYGNVNTGRLSLLSNARIQKLASTSTEKLTCLSEKDNTEIENYYLEYSKYILRKAQNRFLSADKIIKEEKIKKCLVSLKLEFENLLDKYVKLNKEVVYFQTYYDVLTRINRKVEEGDEILKVLREMEVDSLLKTLSNLLDCTVNQLHLVDIDKKAFDDAFEQKIWGSGSELETCLQKINSFISKDKVKVSKIAEELVEIKKLAMDNAMLRERFNSQFKAVSTEIAETNYKLFTGTVKKALDNREQSKEGGSVAFTLDCDVDFLNQDLKPISSQQSNLSLPDIESSCPALPNGSSTPYQNKEP